MFSSKFLKRLERRFNTCTTIIAALICITWRHSLRANSRVFGVKRYLKEKTRKTERKRERGREMGRQSEKERKTRERKKEKERGRGEEITA